jgi:hypothetical protein
MPHAETMRWSSFLEIEPDSRLVRHNRLFSNWFRLRLKLSQSGELVIVHRIAAKRLVLEIQNSRSSAENRPSDRKSGKKAASLIGIVLVAGAVVPASLGVTNAEPRKASETAAQQEGSRTASCATIASREPFEIDDLQSFNVDTWIIKTFGTEISLGALQSVSFEAKCKSEVVVGTLLHSKNESGHLILRMTPIKRPGS